MKFNIYISNVIGAYNIMGLTEDKLEVVINAYKKGKTDFTISGQKYFLDKLNSFQIFTHEIYNDPELFYNQAPQFGIAQKNLFGRYHIPPEGLEKAGKNVTDDILGNTEFGQEKDEIEKSPNNGLFIHMERIEELKKIKNVNFDFTRLIQLCNEINDNYSRNNFLSVAMVGRSILNHVPPLFKFQTFNEVANNYGTKSFKIVMNHLNNTMRGIADSYLHDTIRKKENVPNLNQVNFSQDLDMLLSEIIRIYL
ncbi:MAG: hypothetical protein IT271_15110 [Chitinophagales bacterium]|nr:hypothetical protein [Chitinophagales bacterium]